jgi:threonine 3-dehydrogenase
VNVPGRLRRALRPAGQQRVQAARRLPDRFAAILDPFGNAVHTALSFDLVGEDVLITGGGPIGCMAAAVCRFVGARHVVVTDVNPYRLELARAWARRWRSTRRRWASTWRT